MHETGTMPAQSLSEDDQNHEDIHMMQFTNTSGIQIAAAELERLSWQRQAPQDHATQ